METPPAEGLAAFSKNFTSVKQTTEDRNMRQLTAHKANGLNEAITITVLDEPGAGGAHHVYEMMGAGKTTRIEFQHGPIKEVGLNGISNEALLAIVADRLECFQAGPFACKDNEDALAMIKGGITCLLKRTKKRVDQGIEGTSVQHVVSASQQPKRYCWQEKDADYVHGLSDSVEAAIELARKDVNELFDQKTTVQIWECRPAVAADREEFEGQEDGDEIDFTKPDWFADRWVPETIVREVELTPSNPQPKGAN